MHMEGIDCVHKTMHVDISFLSSLITLCRLGSLSPPILEPYVHSALLQNPSSIKVPHLQAYTYTTDVYVYTSKGRGNSVERSF